jgi:WD40 repeat protein
MNKRIHIEVDKQILHIQPNVDGTALESNHEGELSLTFTNKSQRFANFKVELLPVTSASMLMGATNDQSNGQLENRTVSSWYRIEPESCTKMPPGSSNTFKIVIVKAPIPIYETNLELMARVSAIEDVQLWNMQRVILEIKKPQAPLQLLMPNKYFRSSAGEKFDIPVLVYNHSGSGMYVTLALTSSNDQFDPRWIANGSEIQLYVEPNRPQQHDFICQIPNDRNIHSQVIEFEVTARSDRAATSPREAAQLEILPAGVLEFGCTPQRQRIPFPRQWKDRQSDRDDAFHVTLKNSSNSAQVIELNAAAAERSPHLVIPDAISLVPDQSDRVILKINPRRHWIGLKRRFFYDLHTDIQPEDDDKSPTTIYASPESHNLELEVLPLIPPWFWLLLGLGTVLWLWFWQQLTPRPMHTASVNSVQLNGTADKVFSGSSDKTIRKWNVVNHFLAQVGLVHEAELGQDQKQSIEVLHLKPENNDEIVAGLDDGTIKLWNVLNNESQQSLLEDNASRGDRVFTLEFSPNSQSLFSGHGSGWVRQWDLRNNSNKFVKKLNSGLAIQTMSVLPESSELFLAGRFNRILVWHWLYDQVDIIDYNPQAHLGNQRSSRQFLTVSGQQSYIESIVLIPNLLVVADNHGIISIWDASNRQSSCSRLNQEEQKKDYSALSVVSTVSKQAQPITTIRKCQFNQIDAWLGHDGKPVRSLAIQKAQGKFYLASAGGDGKVKLWRLTPEGGRSQGLDKDVKDSGQVLAHYPGLDLRSVDIKLKDGNSPDRAAILVASDAPNHHVKIYRVKP